MKEFSVISEKNKEVIDITDQVTKFLPLTGGGLVNIFVQHTTSALTIANLDPGTDQDMLDAFAQIMPKLNYRHYHNPAHVVDHILTSMIGNSLTVPFKEGSLLLGSWQRIVLVESDGPQKRNLILNLINTNEF